MLNTKRFWIQITVIGGLILAAAFSGSAAYYRTHRESDSEQFFKTYPYLLGTRLEGCEVCHVRSTTLPPGQKSGTPNSLGACEACHTLTDYGRKPADILTAYGADYMNRGRDAAALSAIAGLDSDGDGASNGAELAAATNPGDRQSAPGHKNTAHVVLSYDELIKKGVAVKEQTLFVNVSKSRSGDSYSDIRGFSLIDVLEAAGISENATGVDVISIDGFATTFSIDELRRIYPQAAPVFGLGKETLGECGWVRYEAKNLKEGVPLSDAGVLLSFEEGGQRYEPAGVGSDNRLSGDGPFRVVAPQMYNPGFPDSSVNAPEECAPKIPEKYRYNRDYEKNADYCVKAVVAIRVNPLPPGEIDIDWPAFGEKMIDEKSVVIFGALRR